MGRRRLDLDDVGDLAATDSENIVRFDEASRRLEGESAAVVRTVMRDPTNAETWTKDAEVLLAEAGALIEPGPVEPPTRKP